MFSNRQPKTESTTVTMQVVTQTSLVDIQCTLMFSSSDPYALQAVFTASQGEPVTWRFARELLYTGMTRPAGEGDVKAWPAAAGSFRLRLSSPSGAAEFQVPLEPVRAFLARTYLLVPEGRENDFLDLDGLIARLLEQD